MDTVQFYIHNQYSCWKNIWNRNGRQNASAVFDIVGFWSSSNRRTTGTETFVGTGTIDIAKLQVNTGDVGLPFQPRSICDELALCQRYYEKSYAMDIQPQTNNSAGVIIFGANVSASQTINVNFKVRKRITPTIYTYSPFSTNPGGTGSTARYYVGSIEATDGAINLRVSMGLTSRHLRP